MDIPTIPGAVYSVVAPNACTITDKATGRVLATTEPNQQKDFRAFGAVTTLSDPDAIYVAASTFSAAPTIGSGGGAIIEFDDTPKYGSTNAVTSGGLYNVLYSSKIKLGNGTGSTGASSINIGFGESTVSHASSVGIGQDIWNIALESVTIGHAARSYAGASVVVGGQARLYSNSVSRSLNGIVIGGSSNVGPGYNSMVIGAISNVNVSRGSVIGPSARLNDESVMLLSVLHGSGADTTSQTLLYLIAANSPLATTYENGEACLGYVVKDSSGNISACGTRKLSELLTNNTAFAPAALDLDAPAPTPFLPTGIMEPIEMEPELLTE